MRLEAQKATDTNSSVRVSLLDARRHKQCADALGAGRSAVSEDVAAVVGEVQGVLEYLKLGFSPAVRLPESYVLDFANAERRIAVQIFDEAEFSIDSRKVWSQKILVAGICTKLFASRADKGSKKMIWKAKRYVKISC